MKNDSKSLGLDRISEPQQVAACDAFYTSCKAFMGRLRGLLLALSSDGHALNVATVTSFMEWFFTSPLGVVSALDGFVASRNALRRLVIRDLYNCTAATFCECDVGDFTVQYSTSKFTAAIDIDSGPKISSPQFCTLCDTMDALANTVVAVMCKEPVDPQPVTVGFNKVVADIMNVILIPSSYRVLAKLERVEACGQNFSKSCTLVADAKDGLLSLVFV